MVLPNNSPGVHSLWIPAFPLKIPLVLKPGSAEPWTPYRIIQALIQAGAPREAFSFYPADHAGAGEILRSCGRGIIFGDSSSTGLWSNDPRMEIHGPGYSKIIIGEDCIDEWEQYLDVMVPRSPRMVGVHALMRQVSGYPRTPKRSVRQWQNDWRKSFRVRPMMKALSLRLSQTQMSRPDLSNDRSESQGTGARDVTAASSGRATNAMEDCSYLLPTIVLSKTPSIRSPTRNFFSRLPVCEDPSGTASRGAGTKPGVTAITSDPELIRSWLPLQMSIV